MLIVRKLTETILKGHRGSSNYCPVVEIELLSETRVLPSRDNPYP